MRGSHGQRACIRQTRPHLDAMQCLGRGACSFRLAMQHFSQLAWCNRAPRRAGRRRTVQCRAFDDVCDDDRARLDERQPQLNNAHGSVIAVLSVTGTSGLPLMRNVEGGWRRYGRFSLAPFVRWARATGGEPSYSSSGQNGEMSVVGWSCVSCCWGTFVGGGHLRSSSAVGDSSRCHGVLGCCAAGAT